VKCAGPNIDISRRIRLYGKSTFFLRNKEGKNIEQHGCFKRIQHIFFVFLQVWIICQHFRWCSCLEIWFLVDSKDQKKIWNGVCILALFRFGRNKLFFGIKPCALVKLLLSSVIKIMTAFCILIKARRNL
jgi:hypothetical protein